MYEWIKILHIAAWTSWMAGLFYLPRLFVYHTERARDDRNMAQTFEVMELKLLRFIMTPAMIVTWASGLFLAWMIVDFSTDIWFHVKLLLVIIMSGFHGFCGRWRKQLAAGDFSRSGRYFRIANEVPTLIFLAIVIMVILKPMI
ncbi:MAG: protoporphyrinogen oxidase HemJ [Neomegalonema sp.]|nr:protoporphyrinogen oxidase HemJ [Neomegalonema sp.]